MDLEDGLRFKKVKEGNLSYVDLKKHYFKILDIVVWDRNADNVGITINFL